jgi:hypothetical protein
MSVGLDDTKWDYGYWCVAFIDLLGQREAFKRSDFIPDAANPEQTEAFKEAVRASVGTIRSMRALHARFKSGMTEAKGDDDPFVGLPEDKVKLARRWQVTHVREFNISDGMMLACPLKPKDDDVPLRGVYETFLTCAALMLAQLALGRPLRGGIDVGTGVEIDNELFGASLVKAYEIESERAQYPRIVLGNDFMNCLRSAHQQSPTGLRAEFERGMAQHMLRGTKVDEDGENILDYAGPELRAELGGAPYTTTILADARAFAQRAREEFRRTSNEKLFGRYSQLVRYLDRSLT